MLRIALLSCFATVAFCHSWLACVDYLEQNGEYWKGSLCRAAARDGKQFAPVDGTFGTDTGFDYNGPSETAPCRTSRNDNGAYDSKHPMAVYFPGQKVVLAHPTKNHVSDTRCTSKYIPDNGNKLYAGPRNHQGEVPLSVYMSNEIYDWGSSPFGHDVPESIINSYPKKGYQNAPKFCENTDKALGTYTWYVPQMQPGTYSFLWSWGFNGPTDLYTGCFEATVVATRAERDAVLRQRGQSTADPIDISGGGGNPVTRPPDVTGPPVNGGWGPWSDWSACNRECGGGEQTRTRHCDNPIPENGGTNCVGESAEKRSCNTQTCPPSNVDFRYTSHWGNGANAEILLPNPKPSGNWYARAEFPCKLDNINVWHASDASIASEVNQGIHRFVQAEWELEKVEIGLTIGFSACNPQEDDVKVSIVQG